MIIKTELGDVTEIKTPLLVVNIFEQVKEPKGATKAIDQKLEGYITRLIHEKEITGKKGETVIIHTQNKLPAERVMVLGLGKPEEFDLDTVRFVSYRAAEEAKKRRIPKFSTILHGGGEGGINPEYASQGIVEGVLLGLYKFKKYIKGEDFEVEEMKIVEREKEKIEKIEKGIRVGRILAESQNIARDFINEPSNVLTPEEFAKKVKEMLERVGVEVEVFDEKWLEEKKMNLILGVGRGSAYPPRLIIARYRGDEDSKKWYGVVGKGVMFDSGGISLKSPSGMETMKGDMAGGAIVFSVLHGIAKLGIKKNVMGVVPAVFNLPDGRAIKPGDILQGYSGKTVEIISTDAEGRLILADALSYAEEAGADPIIDIATLTGGSIVALGDVTSAVFSNDKSLVNMIIEAGKFTGERFWEMPLFPEYREQMKSIYADIKNSGGRKASPITASIFLKEFIKKAKWMHIDVAGKEIYDKDKGYIKRGGTGIGTRSLIHLFTKI